MDRVTDIVKPYSTANPSFKDAGGNNENELNPGLASKLKSPNNNSSNKKQLQHTKNFMSPTISASIKANNNNNNNNVPIRKILADRNETVDVVEQNSVVRRSSRFGSKVMKFTSFDDCGDDNVEKELVGKSSLQPYDPIKNYLSPRPKFLRYNPNRRRKILNLGESDEDCVKSSISFDVGDGNGNVELPSSGLELGSRSGLGSSTSVDSCMKKESVEESVNETEKRGDGEDDERDKIEEEEEMIEFGDDKCWSLKGILKFVFVVLAVILSTQAICSMNSPNNLRIQVSLWGYSNWYSTVYGAVSSNVSEIGYGVMRESDLLVGKLKIGEAYHDHEGVNRIESTQELVEIQDEPMYEVENDETNLRNQESAEKMQLAEVLPVQEIAVSEVLDIGNVEMEKEVKEFCEDGLVVEKEIKAIEVVDIGSVEGEKEVHDSIQDGLTEVEEIKASEVFEVGNEEAEIEVHDSDQADGILIEEAEIEVHDSDQADGILIEDGDFPASEKNFQAIVYADFEMEESMEEVVENEVVDIKTSNVLVKSATFDPTLAVLIGLPILVLMFFGVIYHSKRTKPFSPASIKVAKQSIVAEKEEIKAYEPTPTPSSLVQQEDDEEPLVNPASLQKDVSKEISHTTYAPSVELLGEFVFGEEVTSSVSHYNNRSAEVNASNSFIQTTTVSIDQTKSSHMEMSTGDSQTVKKQRRKNAEVSRAVTPSSVRRSSRLQNRSIMSP